MTGQGNEATADIARLVRVLQFGDSVLPVGSFSFSNGLESAVQERLVHDAGTLAEFVSAAARKAATSDGIALVVAHRAALAADLAAIEAADRAILERKLAEEMREMTVRMGRKLAELGTQVFRAPMLSRWLDAIRRGQTPGSYPAGLGVLFGDLGASEHDAFAVHQYGVAMTTLGAALRLMRVEPRDVQAILYDVNAEAGELYSAIRGAGLADMAGFTPMTDILAAVHVQARVRLFMT